MNKLFMNICHICGEQFSRLSRLRSHLNRKIPCRPQHEETIRKHDPIICQYCHKEFARKDNLLAHLNKGRCSQFNQEKKIIELKKQLAEKDKQIIEIGRAHV